MFSLNGIVYASEKTENIQVVSAKPLDDMMMILTFSTGEQRLFDATILTGEAFAPLSDENIFKNCKVVAGVVTWLDEEIDCAPEYMYTNSYEYPSLKSVIWKRHWGQIPELTTLGSDTNVVTPWTIYIHSTPEAMAEAGVYDDTIRISVGIEDAKDLIQDFTEAVESFKED